MSDFAARAALSRMNHREILLAPTYGAVALAADMQFMSQTDPDEAQAKFLKLRGEMCANYGFDDDTDQQKPFAFANGIAIIPITGTLINRFSYSYGSLTGYNFIRSQLKLALGDEDVTGIIFDVNSYGGEAAGCFELAREIFEAREVKPSLAVVDSNAYSAGYALGSAASRMVVTPSAGVGSIGVIAMHMDISKMLENAGVKIELIYEGDHKADGNPFNPLPAAVKALIKEGIHQSYETFVALVATQRSLDVQVIRDTQSRCFRAEEALSLGLIDAIATPSEAVHAFLGELSGSTTQLATTKEIDMTATAQPGATQAGDAATQAATAQASATAATEARTSERARIDGIVTCDEAKGNEALANHFAFKTDMSVVDAKAALSAAKPAPAPAAAAPVAAPVAAAPVAAAPAAAKPNPFDATMNALGGANVGADVSGNGGDGEQLTHAEMILRDQAAMTGVSFKAKK
jgi:signal peptide peptidase SppA